MVKNYIILLFRPIPTGNDKRSIEKLQFDRFCNILCFDFDLTADKLSASRFDKYKLQVYFEWPNIEFFALIEFILKCKITKLIVNRLVQAGRQVGRISTSDWYSFLEPCCKWQYWVPLSVQILWKKFHCFCL